MKPLSSYPVFILLWLLAGVSAQAAITPETAESARLAAQYGKLPLSFEANRGQTDPQVRFLSRGAGYALFITPTEAVFSMRGRERQQARAAQPTGNGGQRVDDAAVGRKVSGAQSVAPDGQRDTGTAQKPLALRMQLVGANPKARAAGLDELPGKVNYLRGNDPKRWQTGVATYGKVKLDSVYPGVDLVYYGNGRQLEYDFIVAPRADPGVIRLGFAGDAGGAPALDRHGDLLLETPDGALRVHKPAIYQTFGGRRRGIGGGFVLRRERGRVSVGFQVAAYDKDRPLVIDPVLMYSSYLGGNSFELSQDIAVDNAGNAYVTGITESTDFPGVNAKYPHLWGIRDAFVTKLNAAGSQVLYSTYLGGSGYDYATSIDVDSIGNAYVTGLTESTDFPVVNAKYPHLWGGSDAFVTKFSANGTQVLYSTYLGGSSYDIGTNIAVDSTGNAYITGITGSADFPVVNAIYPKYGGNGDVFVTKFNATGTQVLYSTYLGGSDYDGNEGVLSSNGIAVDSAGNAYVTGGTGSSNFPVVNAKFPHLWGLRDAFVTKLNATGSQVLYSTYLGGSDYDYATSIDVDSIGNAYVTGPTGSADFPVVNAKYPHLWGGSDAFVTKFSANGTQVLYSTYLGGSNVNGEEGTGIAVDSAGNAYVTGYTYSSDFPAINATYPNLLGFSDTFVIKFNTSGAQILYSTFLGGSSGDEMGWEGIAVDSAGNAYVTGYTYSADFPTHANDASIVSFDSSYNGNGDAFVTKLGTYGISVVKKGAGAGTVSSNPPGIACGTQCFKPFPPGTKVILSALPDFRSRFARWEGNCAGAQTSCALAVNEGKLVTAVFDSAQALDVQPLVDSLGKLKTQILAKVDSDLEITARAFGDSKTIWRSLMWSDWFGTLLDLVNGTLSTISTAIDVVNEVKSILTNGFVAADTQYKALTWLHAANSLYENLTADGEKLQMAIDGPAYGSAVKTMLQAAHDAACVTVLTVCAKFNTVVYQTVIKNRLNAAATSMIVTLQQSGDALRKKSNGAIGVTETKRKIAAKLQNTIDALKTQGTVPTTFPMEATLDMLNRIRTQVVLSRSGGAVAAYDAMLKNGPQPVKHAEKVSLGRIGDWERLRSVALDHFADNMTIQMASTIKTIPDSAINGLNILSAQQIYKLSNGVSITMTSYGYLTTLLDLQLAAQQKGGSLSARKVIDYAPEQMLNSLGEEMSDLWMIADDVSNKILLDAL